MKKLMIFCVVICALAIGGAMTLKSVQNQRWANPILIENVEAFAAECIYCGRTLPCYCGMGGGSGEDDQEGGEPGVGGGGNGGTCGAKAWTGDSWEIVCKVSYAYAMMVYDWWNTPYKWWCCDSCSSSTYCGN